MAVNMSSPSAERALRSLGSNLKVARLKRRISMKDFAERLGVSERTVARLEKGDGGVRIETLAMACLALGELGRISDFLDVGSDDIGLLLEKERLPKRIRSKAPASSADHDSKQPGSDGSDSNVGGVGF